MKAKRKNAWSPKLIRYILRPIGSLGLPTATLSPAPPAPSLRAASPSTTLASASRTSSAVPRLASSASSMRLAEQCSSARREGRAQRIGARVGKPLGRREMGMGVLGVRGIEERLGEEEGRSRGSAEEPRVEGRRSILELCSSRSGVAQWGEANYCRDFFKIFLKNNAIFLFF